MNVTVFEFGGYEIRGFLVEGKPWFTAADVARLLDYPATAAMTRLLDSQDRGLRDVLGGRVSAISEGGFYTAILGAGDAARAYEVEQWLTDKVLPTLLDTPEVTPEPEESPDDVVGDVGVDNVNGLVHIAVGGSPFDAIMLPGERWSARALMPHLGYGKWENFSTAIERAEATAANSGAVEAISRRQEMVPQGGAPRIDYVLTRFGAYLVAMNGDPRKAEVAAAQAYFAIKTREAEVAPVHAVLPGRKALAEMVIAAEEAREAAEAKVAELAPKAEAFDAFLGNEGLYLVGTVGRILGVGQTTLFKFLYEQKVLIEGGPRRRQPYADPRFEGWFRVRADGRGHTTTYVTARGAEAIRLLALDKRLIEASLIALPELSKEISA